MSESLTHEQQPVNPEAAEDAQEATEAHPEMSLEDALRELAKTRKESAKYRTKAKQLEEKQAAEAEAKRQAEMTAEERAKQAEQRAKEALEAAEKRVQTAERKAALAGKVSNADRVLRLMDDPEQFFNGTEPDVDAILKAFPEYAPKASTVDIPGGKSERLPGSLRPEDFRGKSQAWILEHRHLLK